MNDNKIYLLAKKYYPVYWDRARIDALHDAGKLTDDEYYDIVGVD